MNLATRYVCDGCAASIPLTEPALLCPDCGGLLEVEYDLAAADPAELVRQAAGRRALGLWRWSPLLPPAEPLHLGEGDTPLLTAPLPGLPGLLLKNDTLMPTGSFKDRGFAVAVAAARSHGVRRAFTYSSGNAGASFATYAARAGIEATILVEDVANDAKIAAIALTGARVVRLRYDSSTEVFDAVSALSAAGLHCFVNFVNPLRHEGLKTCAYEICEALGWRAPDVMVHPVGTGGGLYGAWKGFTELRALGLIDRVPRMVGVQPAATAPLVRAFERGEPTAVRHGDANLTVAQSIAGDAPIQGGARVLRAVHESGGRMAAVEDEELYAAMRLLGRQGVGAEPSAAASTAALLRARAEGWVSEGETVVSVVTGGALKQPSALTHAAPPPAQTVRASAEELLAALS
ncbi:MAG: pyridoxal-phosphate dependent enzyme [Nonomuraea sp.]|nr:pyridoxal-phosphate dependent enzyme [Nonomuraea sp.]